MMQLRRFMDVGTHLIQHQFINYLMLYFDLVEGTQNRLVNEAK